MLPVATLRAPGHPKGHVGTSGVEAVHSRPCQESKMFTHTFIVERLPGFRNDQHDTFLLSVFVPLELVRIVRNEPCLAAAEAHAAETKRLPGVGFSRVPSHEI